jgi:DNA-binding NtrC family response regulator
MKMPKVLVVDDEEVYRRQLQVALLPDGHEVRTAASGREAIDVGARFRPDVLVADWMLKDHLHGLHVARVLRTVTPHCQAILITGFASNHLRAEASRTPVCRFIEKPFDLQQIRSAVRQAASRNGSIPDEPTFGVVELAADGRIRFANSKARELFALTRAGASTECFESFFADTDEPDWAESRKGWLVASPLADRAVYWCLRSQPPRGDGSRLVVMRGHDEPQYVDQPLIEMLLGTQEADPRRWPLQGRVLIIDHEALTRGLSVSLLESAGASSYAVETLAEGLRLLEKDEGLRLVVLDHDLGDGALPDVVEQIRAVRPDIVIVGAANSYLREAFTEAGVDRFVQKPWRVESLAAVVSGENDHDQEP